MGFNCLKAKEPLRGDSSLFNTKSPVVPGTNFINLERIKGWVNLGATQWFRTPDPSTGNPARALLQLQIQRLQVQIPIYA